MSVWVLFEDNHLLIVDKPAGLVTQPSKEHSDSMETRAKVYLKEKYQKPGDVFLHAVHRLDKEVAGIVIFAKTSKALSRMNLLIREGKLLKIYRAKVEGIFLRKEGRLSDFLVKHSHYAAVASVKNEQAKESVLSYKVLSKHPDGSLLEIELDTGRYHQIRAQMSARGHPIIGDRKYGSKTSYADGHIDLQHVRVAFEHPVHKTSVNVVSHY